MHRRQKESEKERHEYSSGMQCFKCKKDNQVKILRTCYSFLGINVTLHAICIACITLRYKDALVS